MEYTTQNKLLNSEWESVDLDYSHYNPDVISFNMHYYPKEEGVRNDPLMQLSIVIKNRKYDVNELRNSIINYCKSMHYRYTLNCQFKVKITYYNLKTCHSEVIYSD